MPKFPYGREFLSYEKIPEDDQIWSLPGFLYFFTFYAQPISALSKMIVNGPSFKSSTCIMAPNSPRSTSLTSSLHFLMIYVILEQL